MNIAERLKELRTAAGVTQKELASSTGIALQSIINYENGRREPNSKAMVALERYFKVSGEFLRGEVDRETFLQNSAAIQGQLDTLVGLFQTFKLDFDCSSQERQMLAVSVLTGVMQTVTERLLRDDGPADLDADQVAQVVRAAFSLNTQGRAESGQAGRGTDTAGSILRLTPFVYMKSLPSGAAPCDYFVRK